LKYSRDFYGKVHFVAIAKLDFGASHLIEFKYDRYPNGGPERIQAGDGTFARKDGHTWLISEDWGENGQPADAQTSKRLNNWVGLISATANGDSLPGGPNEHATTWKFTGKRDQGDRESFVFEDAKGKSRRSPTKISFDRYKSEKDSPVLLAEFSGPMHLGLNDAMVKISFSHMVTVQMVETTASPAAAASPAMAKPEATSAENPAADLLDGKLKIDVPPDFVREPNDPKEPKTLARFARSDGAWGEVLRGTHGLTPEQLDGYLKKRVEEYSKGFNWLPKNSHLQWLRKEIVTIDGRKWADWRYVPMLKAKKDYRSSPVYTRFLTTSYKGQLLEITFTTNLNTEPALKEEIDRIMDSVRLEE
jgi:hypothetical protein